ncbi:MAG: Gfo/Idh/MocA family oxidoreductase [Bacteroidota bacterium]
MKTQSLASPGYWPTVAVIGCGAISEAFYLPALSSYPEVLQRLILVDSDAARARKMGERFHVATRLTDYRDIIGSLDGAIVAVPHHLHYSISKDLLAAGVHILCEKPLTERAAEAKELIQLAERNGITLSVNHTRRLMPSSRKVKQLLVEEAIGNIHTIVYLDGTEFNWPTASGFYFDSTLSAKGVLLDLGSHVFDLLCWWLGGKPKLVSSENDSFGGCEAVASVLIEHKGCRCEIRLSRLSKLPNFYRITGDRGYIEGGVYDWRSITVSTVADKGKARRINLRDGDSTNPENGLIASFLSTIKNEGQPLVPAKDVLDSIELLEEAYKKARRFSLPWYDLQGSHL